MSHGPYKQAVDFVKTGTPVKRDKIRKPRYDLHVDKETKIGLRPDWQAGHGRDPTDGRHYECPRFFLFFSLDFDFIADRAS